MVPSLNYDTAFNVIARDLSSYYSLGYKPPDSNEKSAADRRLVVKAKNHDYHVRARQTYAAKSLEEAMNDRIISNIYHGSIKSEWPIILSTGMPEREGDRYKVPITITIPPNNLTLLPQESQLVGGFNVYIAVGTNGGSMSKVSKAAQPIKIPLSGERDLMSKPMTYQVTIMVRPGESTLSVGIADQISNVTGFARTKIYAQ